MIDQNHNNDDNESEEDRGQATKTLFMGDKQIEFIESKAENNNIRISEKSWILLTFLGMLCMLAENFCISVLGSKAGPFDTLKYLAPGQFLVVFGYNVYLMIMNQRRNGTFWINNNLVIDSKINYRNLIGQLLFTIQFFGSQSFCSLSIYYAGLAHVNSGIITIIWRASIFSSAVADWYFFGQKLKYFHILGLLAIVVCVILIGLAKMQTTTEQVNISTQITPVWIPFLFAVGTTLFFTANAIQIKHLTQPRIGFDINRLTINQMMLLNACILIFAAIPFWFKHGFQSDLMYIGCAGGAMSGFGMLLLNNAYSLGPCGPIAAIQSLSSPLLVVIMAFQTWTMLQNLEILGVFFGMLGALVMTNHELFEKYVFCCKQSKNEKILENINKIEL